MSNLNSFTKNIVKGLLEEQREQINAILQNIERDLEVSLISELFSFIENTENNNIYFKDILDKIQWQSTQKI